jgi:hypothetical protein
MNPWIDFIFGRYDKPCTRFRIVSVSSGILAYFDLARPLIRSLLVYSIWTLPARSLIVCQARTGQTETGQEYDNARKIDRFFEIYFESEEAETTRFRKVHKISGNAEDSQFRSAE